MRYLLFFLIFFLVHSVKAQEFEYAFAAPDNSKINLIDTCVITGGPSNTRFAYTVANGYFSQVVFESDWTYDCYYNDGRFKGSYTGTSKHYNQCPSISWYPDNQYQSWPGRCRIEQCPNGKVRYEDGQCDDPPDCEGAKNMSVIVDAITNCVDYCSVSDCTKSTTAWKDGEPVPGGTSYACYYTGSHCQSEQAHGGGGDPGGSDPGGGDPGSDPGGGDPGSDPGGGNPGGGPGGDPGGNPGGDPGGTPGGTPGGKPGGTGDGEDKEGQCPSWLKWVCGDATIGELEVPNASQFNDAYFKDTFTPLQSLSLPSGSGSCAPMQATLFNKVYSVSFHCDMMGDNFIIFQTVMMAIWSLIAFRIVMSA
jgi:hypothetical protein